MYFSRYNAIIEAFQHFYDEATAVKIGERCNMKISFRILTVAISALMMVMFSACRKTLLEPNSRVYMCKLNLELVFSLNENLYDGENISEAENTMPIKISAAALIGFNFLAIIMAGLFMMGFGSLALIFLI